MKKYALGFVAAAALTVALAGVASASTVTLTFSGSDIVASAPVAVNSGTPIIGDGSIDAATGTIRTYTTTGDPAGFNAWLGSLVSGYGISSFNLWLQDGLSGQSASWGETVALTQPQYNTDIHPFASAGWTASVATVGGEWGAHWLGSELITYTANGAANYLRPGTTATFGFTADMTGVNDGAGPYQIWVGSGDIVGNVAANGQFQRVVGATAVPLPASVWTGLSGLAFVVGLGLISKLRPRLQGASV